MTVFDPLIVEGLLTPKNKKAMQFLGVIETVVPDYTKNESANGLRLYLKLATYDDMLHEQSIYVRIQGHKAQQVLDMMDETGNVRGIWQAELAVNVVEYPGKDRTIYANLVHCTELQLVDADYPDCRITPDDRALAHEIIPVVVDDKKTPCVLTHKRSIGFMNWIKNILSL